MKKLLTLALVSVSLVSGGRAAIAVGSGAELFFTGMAGVRWDDNILLEARNEKSDTIFDVAPGVELSYGKNAQLSGSISASETLTRYADNSRLNTDLFTGDFTTSFDDGKMKLGFASGFHELNQNTADVRGLARRDVFTAAADAEVEASQLTSFAVGAHYTRENFQRTDFSDAESFTVPIDLFYKWRPKVDLSLGYRFRDYQLDLGQNSKDHFLSLGARGDFSPKLAGRVAVGWNRRTLERGGSHDDLGVEAKLGYELTPKTTLQIGASKDFGTSPLGQQEKNTTFQALLVAKLTAQWSASGGASYRRIDYGSHTDDYVEGQIGFDYVATANVRIVGAYTRRDYNSTQATAEFANNVFSIAANLRF
jgi:hypothetical protein